MTPEQLASVAGIVLSLAFSYIPGLADWYAALDSAKKRLVMLSIVVAIAASAFGLTCAKIVLTGVTVTCDQAGAVALVQNVIAALVANQATFLLTPRRMFRRTTL